MPAVLDTYPLSKQHLEPAGQALGRALVDDPAWLYVLPSPEQRARNLVWLLNMGLRYAERFGEVLATGSPVIGAAVWLPPGETTITPDRLDQVGFAAAPARLGAEAFTRFERFVDRLAEMHATLMPEPHWYLMTLGVEPAMQGRGAGRQLLQPVIERADRDGLPCYLETTLERNVSFFARHGFRHVGEASLPGAPRTWLMMRRAVR